MNRRYKQWRGLLFGFLITVIVGMLIIRNVDITELPEALLNINLQIFILSILLSLITNIFVSSYKLKGILKMLGLSVTMKEVLFIKLGSDPFVTIFPLRSGELSKTVYLKRILGLPASRGVAFVVLDLGGNLMALIFILFIGILLYPLRLSLLEAGIVTVAALSVFIFLTNIFSKMGFLKGDNKRADKALIDKVKRATYEFLSNFKKINLMGAFFIFGLSFVQMFGELIIFFLLSKSLGLLLPFKAVLFFFPLINIIARFPMAFLGLGPREAAVIIFFSNFAEKTALLSLGILYSFVEYIFPVAVGLIFLPFFAGKISDAFFNNKNFNIELLNKKI